jgi:SAM-dependent methyltransferase
MTIYHTCPNCGASGLTVFYEIDRVPVHSVLLLTTQDEAINYPTGDIKLGFCDSCGFISNVVFDPGLHEYSSRYEATQSFSPTFTAFSTRLANHLIERHNLHSKDIIEIGCGQGEFLTQLAEMGDNRGIGFDPAYVDERSTSTAKDRITFIPDFYSEKYTDQNADFVVCKMTLEHIPRTADFVNMVRRSVGDRHETVIFFQVPNVRRVLRDVAFWDIYYEHCSYFSLGSLARLFRRCGFDVIDLVADYDDQYVMIEAKPASGAGSPRLSQEDDLDDLRRDLAYFVEQVPARLDQWRGVLDRIRDNHQRAVIWGGGSKGVSFLTTLGIRDEIPYAVDINPHKNGMYMAGTGQQTVLPEFLKDYRPDLVIVMNPIYCAEIQQKLDDLGVTAELMSV